MTATPNQALQKTGSAVTAPAADHRHLSAHRQVPRLLRLSLNPHHPTSTGDSLAGGRQKQITAMRFVKGAGIFRQG